MFGQYSTIKRVVTWIAPVPDVIVLAPNFEVGPPHIAPYRVPPSVYAFVRQRPGANFTRRWGWRNAVLIASRVRHPQMDVISTQVFEANIAFSSR